MTVEGQVCQAAQPAIEALRFVKVKMAATDHVGLAVKPIGPSDRRRRRPALGPRHRRVAALRTTASMMRNSRARIRKLRRSRNANTKIEFKTGVDQGTSRRGRRIWGCGRRKCARRARSADQVPWLGSTAMHLHRYGRTLHRDSCVPSYRNELDFWVVWRVGWLERGER